MNNNARKYNRYNEVDERILALFAENKEKAFRLLYDTYYLPLCLYSVQFTGSTETSEDIVQNLFVSFWDKTHIPPFPPICTHGCSMPSVSLH